MLLSLTLPGLNLPLSITHNSAAYHMFREAQAGAIVRITKDGTATNLVDMINKLLPGPKLRDQAEAIMWQSLDYIEEVQNGQYHPPFF